MNTFQKAFVIAATTVATGCSLSKQLIHDNKNDLTEQQDCDCLAEKFVNKAHQHGAEIEFQDYGKNFVKSKEFLQSKSGKPTTLFYLVSTKDGTLHILTETMSVDGMMKNIQPVNPKTAAEKNSQIIRDQGLKFMATPAHKTSKKHALLPVPTVM